MSLQLKLAFKKRPATAHGCVLATSNLKSSRLMVRIVRTIHAHAQVNDRALVVAISPISLAAAHPAYAWHHYTGDGSLLCLIVLQNTR